MQRLIERMCPYVAVRTAADGQEALAVCDQALPALIISDIMMPGMDGIALITELRARALTCPVIAISANEMLEPQALKAGANAFVSKAEIFSALQPLLERFVPQTL
jgi:two-component system cell cycle response regulator